MLTSDHDNPLCREDCLPWNGLRALLPLKRSSQRFCLLSKCRHLVWRGKLTSGGEGASKSGVKRDPAGATFIVRSRADKAVPSRVTGLEGGGGYPIMTRNLWM